MTEKRLSGNSNSLATTTTAMASFIFTTILSIIIVLLCLYVYRTYEFFDQGRYNRQKLTTAKDVPAEIKNELIKANPKLLEEVIKIRHSDGTQTDVEYAQWTILQAVFKLGENNIVEEILFSQEWNRTYDKRYDFYFAEGTDTVIARVLKEIGATDISSYFSAPIEEREEASYRLKEVGAEHPNEWYASVMLLVGLIDRRLAGLGWLLCVSLGTLGASLEVAHGILTNKNNYITENNSIGFMAKLPLRIVFGGAAGFVMGVFFGFLLNKALPDNSTFVIALVGGYSVSLVPDMLIRISEYSKKQIDKLLSNNKGNTFAKKSGFRNKK